MSPEARPAKPPPARLTRGRTAGRVTWRSLSLQGFGPFRNRHRVEFPDGLVAVVGPNEAGKSSLVAGLTAVLFGLRSTRDARSFGQERFRSWHGPERFEGELEFVTGDGREFRLRRDFESQWVELLRRDGPEWVRELSMRHDPRARGSDLEYEQRLQDLIGIGSRELFSATFCVNQPMPGMVGIDDAVQQLLAGAGGSAHPRALDRLAQELASLTRHTGDLGVTPRNGPREQRLDAGRRQVEARARDLEDSREALDSLVTLEDEIAALGAERDALRSDGAAHEVLQGALAQWLTLAERRAGLLRHRAELQDAASQARRLQQEARELRARIDGDPAAGLDPEAEQRLEGLVHLERERARLEAERAELEAGLEEARGALAAMEGLFRQEFDDLEGRPDVVLAVQGLRERIQELAALDGRLEALSEEESRARAELDRLPDLGQLGRPVPDACRWLNDEQDDVLRKWQRWHDGEGRLDALDRELAGYVAFDRADAATLDLLRNHAAIREQLQARRFEAASELEQVEMRRLSAAHEQTRIRNAFVDVANIDAALISAIEARIGLHERDEALEAELAEAYRQAARLSERRMWLMVSMLVIGLAIGGLVPLLFKAAATTCLTASVSLAALMGGLGHLLGRASMRDPTGAVLEKRAALDREIEQLQQPLGVFARDALYRLGAVKERWERWQERLKEYDEAFRELPPPEHAATLRERRDAADRAINELKVKVRGYALQYHDPVEAIQRWKELRAERERAEQERAAFCVEEWGCAPTAVPDRRLDDVGGAWKRLGDLVALAGLSRDDTVIELVRTLRRVGEDWWEEMGSQAQRWEAVAARLEAARSEREHLTRPDDQGLSRRERLQERIRALRELVAPYDEKTEVEALGRMVATARTLEMRIESSRSRVADLERRLDENTVGLERTDRDMAGLKARLGDLLRATDSSLVEARARWRALQEARRQLEGVEGGLASTLALWRVEALEALEQRELESTGALREMEASLAGLSDRFEALPRLEAAEDLAGVRATEAATRVRGAEIREQADACAEGLRALEARQARLEGRELVNVAAEERELVQARREVEALELEAEALACAWTELRDTVEDYQASYRERLEVAATRRFVDITGRAGRSVRLDADFRVSVREEGGRLVAPFQMSQGARDQLYLCLRLAISDLVSPALRLPFVFDDPFLNCDEARLDRLRLVLERISRERQVVVMSHRASVAAWGKPLEIKG